MFSLRFWVLWCAWASLCGGPAFKYYFILQINNWTIQSAASLVTRMYFHSAVSSALHLKILVFAHNNPTKSTWPSTIKHLKMEHIKGSLWNSNRQVTLTTSWKVWLNPSIPGKERFKSKHDKLMKGLLHRAGVLERKMEPSACRRPSLLDCVADVTHKTH